MSFYMDNILGGSNPSTQAVTGVASTQIMNDQVPLPKSNRAAPPVKSGVPLKNAKLGPIPLHTVLNGTTDSALQNNTKNMDNGGDELPFGNRAQLSLDRVMFGTRGAQRRAWFRFGWKGTRILCNTLSFFGVRNTAVSESHLAIMGGTGKYTSAKGFATITTTTSTSHISLADEAKSLLRFSVFLA
ncbi:hypothetical protein C5167_000981 [Papaver somniferum]|uniref:Dirigent protein n=1 Tax=Papaver somniferum TaxID=3469 RepID=A0A4Y7KXP8_PAPSO|nr:hypothetical protein C5167_000981 [Papaver somniferum]